MDFKYFFTNEEAIEEAGLDIGFDLYSAGHLIWLAVILTVGILLSSWYKKQDDDKRRFVRKFFGVAIVCSEIYRDTILIVTGYFGMHYLPLHLCGLAIFAIVADAFWEKQKVTKQVIAYAFMPGAVSALLFCNWTVYPYLNFMNIHSFVFHGWIFFYFLMQYRAGEIRPDYKGIWKSMAMLLIIVFPLFKFNQTFGSNYLFINEASEGSPLVPLWNLFGETYGHFGYILSCAVMVLVVFHILYCVYKVLGMKKR